MRVGSCSATCSARGLVSEERVQLICNSFATEIRTGTAHNLLYAKETHKHITSATIYMTNIYFTKAEYNLTVLQYIVYNSHLVVIVNVLLASRNIYYYLLSTY